MNAAPELLAFHEAAVWMFVGILISVVLPVAVRTLQRRTEVATRGKRPGWAARMWRAWQEYGGNRYVAVLLAAAVVAAALVFLLGLSFYTPRDAALAGFGWESLVNKLFGQKQS
jgi:hypothetical protein